MNYTTPSADLVPYIDRFWWITLEPNTPLFPLIAGTGAELIFGRISNLHYRLIGRAVPFFPVSLFYIRTEPLSICVPERTTLLAVRIRTGMLHHFMPPGTTDSLPALCDARDIWGDSISDVYEQISHVVSPEASVPVIESYLRCLLKKYRSDDFVVDSLARLLYYRSDFLSVEDVAEKVGYSRRQLQRKCRHNFGFSPKEYLSIARFNRIYRSMVLHTSDSPLDHGFFDQSHFIHSCRKFTGMTPSMILKERDNMSHFYNTSLPFDGYFQK